MPEPSSYRSLGQELGKQDPFESAAQEAYLNIVRTADVLARFTTDLCKTYGLSEPLYNVMRIVLGHGDEGIPSQRIAGFMVARGPDVTRLVDRLVAMALVSRRRTESDRRVVRIVITPQGRALAAKLSPAVLEMHRQQLGHMSDKKLRQLSALLVEARQSVDAEGADAS